jgi:hypothetical protein
LRQEDKEVDGPELKRAQRLEHNELETKRDDLLPAPALDQVRELARVQRGELLATIQAIFARDRVILDTLRFPQHELRALAALKTAVDGRDLELAQFVYASDRKELLEQALAVLQPNLELRDASYLRLVRDVQKLRDTLARREAAQDELEDFHSRKHIEHAAGVDDKDDSDANGDAAERRGDDVERPPDGGAQSRSTLYGAERAAAPATPSTLFGDAATPSPPQPSSLYGDAPPSSPPPPSTLGDPTASETAPAQSQEAPRKPWWKRPFGKS